MLNSGGQGTSGKYSTSPVWKKGTPGRTRLARYLFSSVKCLMVPIVCRGCCGPQFEPWPYFTTTSELWQSSLRRKWFRFNNDGAVRLKECEWVDRGMVRSVGHHFRARVVHRLEVVSWLVRGHCPENKRILVSHEFWRCVSRRLLRYLYVLFFAWSECEPART